MRSGAGEEAEIDTPTSPLLSPAHEPGPGGEASSRRPGRSTPVAEAVAPLVRAVLGRELPLRVEFWDGSAIGPPAGPGTLRLRGPAVLRRLFWSPDELGIARAFVSGDLELDGDLFAVLRALREVSPKHLTLSPRVLLAAARAAQRAGAVGGPLPPPASEIRLGRLGRHSKGHDATAIRHHYDVGNDFYELVLGPSLTYSCARFVTPTTTLEEAQAAKHELVCRKLGLEERPDARLLDVGCGWGSLVLHAARHHGARAVGITLSEQQATLARKRVAEAGLTDRVEIRLQDYRDLGGERFDAISSIGMFEHVGSDQTARYFSTLRELLTPYGRLLNHAISKPGGTKLVGRQFMSRYVFPDGELLDVAEVVAAMERAGFEVRDVESLREHYSRTLHAWVENLERGLEAATRLVGDERVRVWRFYMAASANAFDDGGIAVHQVLGVVPDEHGAARMPATRRDWD